MRELREMSVDCIVGAVSKMHKPASDRRKKNDRNDAEFLARQLMARNIVEVFVPDVETEGARNLSRALEDIREDLTRAKHRLTHLLIRWGIYLERVQRRWKAPRQLDPCALGVDPRNRAFRRCRSRVPRLLHLRGAPYRIAEEGHREESGPIRLKASLTGSR